jgi:hypothetical protein
VGGFPVKRLHGRSQHLICQQLSPVATYTGSVARLLRQFFVDSKYRVIPEWRPMLRDEVRSPRTRTQVMYSPAIDLAVGPFAISRSYVAEYDRMAQWSADMLGGMLRAFERNLRKFDSRYTAPSLERLCTLNMNARCFLAIEIERGNASVKYLMGSTFNASALGRVGIVVAWDRHRLADLLRAREYFSNLGEIGKNTFDTGNMLFLSKEQVIRVLTRHAVLVQSPPYRSKSFSADRRTAKPTLAVLIVR